MDAEQLEEYRRRMQARYQSHGRDPAPARAPAVSNPPPISQQSTSHVAPEEDERLARQLQEEEQRRMDEEYAKQLQNEENHPPDVPPPANVQREERLVEPVYSSAAYAPGPPGPQRPLLPGRGSQRQRSESCWPESETCCGFSDQFCIWVIALCLTGAIVSGLLVLLYQPR